MKDKIEYLKNFYTESEIFSLTSNDGERINYLYELCQPQDISIGDSKTLVKDNICFVDSPDGWVKVSDWVEKQQKPVYSVTFSNKKIVKASYDHLFQSQNLSWIYTENLKLGDKIISDDGISTVIGKEFIGGYKVYDLSVAHENHRYYTNGMCSHNTGKSLFLQNLALNWVEMGLNVVYITLELSEELTGMRLNAMITGKSTTEVYRESDEVAKNIKTMHKFKKWGEVTIKFMPIGTTSYNLRSYLKEYEIQKGFKPDCVLIDYLDLLHPTSRRVDPSNLFVKDKYVSEELRSMMKECNLIGATASQLNRCLDLESVVEEYSKGEVFIKDVQVGDRIFSDNGYVVVEEVYPITKQAVYEIKTKSGKVIRCSEKHLFPTENGLKSIESGLGIGNRLFVKGDS